MMTPDQIVDELDRLAELLESTRIEEPGRSEYDDVGEATRRLREIEARLVRIGELKARMTPVHRGLIIASADSNVGSGGERTKLTWGQARKYARVLEDRIQAENRNLHELASCARAVSHPRSTRRHVHRRLEQHTGCDFVRA